jgi:outer membrane protein OmpA-like peptidoglycan-associated protein
MKFGTTIAVCLLAVVSFSTSCATKKYVRNSINERVTPVENRTGELEETSRRNTQEISRLSREVQDVRGLATRAQEQADRAASSAEQANTRVTGVEESVADLRANLDKYGLQKTVTVFFEVNKSILSPEATAQLDDLAGQIKDRNGFLLEIEGFASSDGNAVFNQQLSDDRCEAVKRYLAEQHNIPLFRMYILGFGTARPIADNSTKEGRQQNRRVEVRLLASNISSRHAQ